MWTPLGPINSALIAIQFGTTRNAQIKLLKKDCPDIHELICVLRFFKGSLNFM